MPRIPNIFLENTLLSRKDIESECKKNILYMDSIGIKRQSTIMVSDLDIHNYIYWLFACIFSGKAFVPFSHQLPAAEKEKIKNQIQPALVVEEKLSIENKQNSQSHIMTGADEILAIIASSGTTGESKYIALSYNNFLAQSDTHKKFHQQTNSDIWLCCLPVYQIGGLNIIIRAFILQQDIVLVKKFRSGKINQSLKRHSITGISLVPTMLLRLLQDGFEINSQLKAILIGGDAPNSKILALINNYPQNIPIVFTYGLTEACSQIAIQKTQKPINKYNSFTQIAENIEWKVNQENELLLKGPSICAGEYKQKKIIPIVDESGFLHTGDLAEKKHSELVIIGRKKDIFISGGLNINPQEIENILYKLPKIKQCVVCSINDIDWGDKVVAAYSTTNDVEIPVAELKQYLKQNLNPKKIPKEFYFFKELPQTKNSKIIRSKVKEIICRNKSL